MASNVRTGTGNGCSAREHRSTYFNHRNSTDQITRRVAMRILELMGVDTIPNLAFKKPAGHQLLFPELVAKRGEPPQRGARLGIENGKVVFK